MNSPAAELLMHSPSVEHTDGIIYIDGFVESQSTAIEPEVETFLELQNEKKVKSRLISMKSSEVSPIFAELMILDRTTNEIKWKEVARWVKFEEEVEQGGNRWSKPHVATLSLQSIYQLKDMLKNATVMLDMTADNLTKIVDLALDEIIVNDALLNDAKQRIREILLSRYCHQYEYQDLSQRLVRKSLKNMRHCLPSYSTRVEDRDNNDYIPDASCNNSRPLQNTTGVSKNSKDLRGSYLLLSDQGVKSQIMTVNKNNCSSTLEKNTKNKTGNVQFMNKIIPGTEAINILVGEVDFLKKPLCIFIRLEQSKILDNFMEIPIPTRFIFILLGPMGIQSEIKEIGRAIATIIRDENFYNFVYKATNKNHLLLGIDEFLSTVTVLPPSEWNPTIRLEPPVLIQLSKTNSNESNDQNSDENTNEDVVNRKLREKSGLTRTGRLFGGLINDIRRKKPFYLSDFKDALSLQSVASFIFLYFACLSPIITFGGLLSQATGQYMGAMESLVAAFICGIFYGFFSGQPLTILGSTGPVLVFETIIHELCVRSEWSYMSFRFWIGSWIALILLILVAIDASAFVCFITRFTEESFAILIAFIFIYQAIESVLMIGTKFPINPKNGFNLSNNEYFCNLLNNSTINISNEILHDNVNWTTLNDTGYQIRNVTFDEKPCYTINSGSNVFLMSIILFIGTFILAIKLKNFKELTFFSSKVRRFISDFAIIIAISSMTLLDFFVGISTPKLEVPSEFKPTHSARNWIIMPFHENPWWSAPLAFLPALLGTILIFMDQQITAVIVNRKENKLKKGCGYHLDLLILAILIQICSIFGLPWFVAATVLSLNHVNSLKLESECVAPGEKAQFLGVREQRLTHLLIFITIGCSVFLTSMLKHIPMPVLFGVFLYMGISSLDGLEFFNRMLIMLMPIKYQPDHNYLRQIPLRRVHMFTIIQLACLVCLWIIKSFHSTSILFPLMLVVIVGIRKLLDFMFSHEELQILDDILPKLPL